MSCDVVRRCGSDLTLLWLWYRPAAMVPIRPLAWELPYITGAALKRPKKKKKQKTQQNKMYIYTVEYYSAIKKNKIMPFAATWMEILILSEVSQKEKDKYHMISLICEIQNMAQMNLSIEQKQSHGHGEQTCSCQGEKGWTGSLGLTDANWSR